MPKHRCTGSNWIQKEFEFSGGLFCCKSFKSFSFSEMNDVGFVLIVAHHENTIATVNTMHFLFSVCYSMNRNEYNLTCFNICFPL